MKSKWDIRGCINTSIETSNLKNRSLRRSKKCQFRKKELFSYVWKSAETENYSLKRF
jgi:hypothetical protein